MPRLVASEDLSQPLDVAKELPVRGGQAGRDLRHTSAVLAASTGTTLADLMARLGHSTPGAAMRYQHAAEDRDRVIAGALSQLVAGNVTPINPGQSSAGGHVVQSSSG